MKKLQLILITLIFPIFSFTQDKDFSDFDEDGDGLIERFEFVDVFTDHYIDQWNNTDDGLNNEGFYKKSFAVFNVNDDVYIDEDEWATGYTYFYGDYVRDDFDLYDTDGDGFIEYAEYYDAMYDSEYFALWDLDNDGFLTKYELANAIFDNWDINNNALINKSEFKMFDSYYLDE